jgi:PAS domain S-box-containing protein
MPEIRGTQSPRGRGRLVVAAACFVTITGVVLMLRHFSDQCLSLDRLLHGYFTNPVLVCIHVCIDICCLVISVGLGCLIFCERRKISFYWLLPACGLLVAACSGLHFVEVITPSALAHWLSGSVKILTYVVSAPTVAILPFTVSPILALVKQAKTKTKSTDVMEKRFADLFEASPDAMVMIDHTGKIALVNSQVTQMFGFSKEELIGNLIEILVPERLRAKHSGHRAEYFTNPRGRHSGGGLELSGRRKDGTEFPIEISLIPLHTPEGVWVSSSIRDITARKRAQEQLLASERIARQLVEGAKDYAIFALDGNGMIVSWNVGAERMSGYKADEVIGQHFSKFYPEEDLKEGKPARVLAQVSQTGRFEEDGWRLRKDGSRFWANVLITGLYDAGGGLTGYSNITLDLTERRRVEEKLRQSEAKFSKAFQSSPIAVTISTVADGRFVDVNDAFLRIVGLRWDQVVGHSGTDLNLWASPEIRPSMIQELEKNGTINGFETTLKSKSRGLRDVRIYAQFVQLDDTPCVVAVTEDITEAKSREIQYRQIQKMEATGQLAGGIAHDFNNILNVILGYCELILQRIPVTNPSRKQIEQIDVAAKRATDLTRQLLAFGRKQVMRVNVLDLNSVIIEMGDMLRRLIREDIEISTSLAGSLWPIKADQTQIAQILINLVVNARDALPSEGKITIETANTKLKDEYINTHVQVTPGEYVRLTVSDTGVGMDQETQTRIFEPFFTTKELGKGTGLGLSTVYGIVKQSGGFIWVYSEPGRGTAFKLYFPRTEEPRQDGLEERTLVGNSRGTETVLVLEDNGQLRELAVEFLESHGYKVLQADDPETALEIARTYDGPIDVVVSDVVLPKMSGRVMADKLVEIRPQTRILFVSGYTDDVIVRHGILNEGVAFLQKPYSCEQLTSKVRMVIDDGSSQGSAVASQG